MRHLKSRPLFRALGLLWSRIGPARIYVLAGAAVLLVLASVGLVHLLSSGSGDNQNPAMMAPGPTDREALIAITEIGSSETKGRNGQKNVAVKIGVAPRPSLRKKGEVEIRVAFFDLTETNEMRPTDAEVNYEWLTPIRDWTDPTPKYLIATYEGAAPSRKSLEKVRYGGFVVRVYLDGQLQAEQSEPRELVAALRSKAIPAASRAALASEQARNPVVRVVATPSPPAQVNRESSSAAPYGSPVPDKPGFVYSPHNPKFLIDVRGFPPGTEVNDPNTGKLLKVP